MQVTPGPYQPEGPGIVLGGSSEAAARRAARIADGFVPTAPEIYDFYRDEVQRLGRPDPGPGFVSPTVTVALAEDPESGWEQMGAYFLHETNTYGAWVQPGVPSPYRTMADLDELRASGLYSVLTPDQFVEQMKAAPIPLAFFHPLCGGMPIDVAWSSLHLFETQVLPAFA